LVMQANAPGGHYANWTPYICAQSEQLEVGLFMSNVQVWRTQQTGIFSNFIFT
jgi:hypothetical protein